MGTATQHGAPNRDVGQFLGWYLVGIEFQDREVCTLADLEASDLVGEPQTARTLDGDRPQSKVDGDTLIFPPDTTVATDPIHRNPGQPQKLCRKPP